LEKRKKIRIGIGERGKWQRRRGILSRVGILKKEEHQQQQEED